MVFLVALAEASALVVRQEMLEGIGDALGVAAMADRAGATVTIRMPDIYPSFPYIDSWTSWDDWYAKVDTMITAVAESGATNIYGYEIWNEPDWTFPDSSFYEVWSETGKCAPDEIASATANVRA